MLERKDHGNRPISARTILLMNSYSLVVSPHSRREQQSVKMRAASAMTARLRVLGAPCVPNFEANLDEREFQNVN